MHSFMKLWNKHVEYILKKMVCNKSDLNQNTSSFWLLVSFLHDYGMIKLIIELNVGFV